jgi:GGDEF domain-containing protein
MGSHVLAAVGRIIRNEIRSADVSRSIKELVAEADRAPYLAKDRPQQGVPRMRSAPPDRAAPGRAGRGPQSGGARYVVGRRHGL